MEALSSDILDIVFSYLADDKETVRNLRLVSRYVNALSSIYLIHNIKLQLNAASLNRLETLCKHIAFHQSIRRVTIDAAYLCPHHVRFHQSRIRGVCLQLGKAEPTIYAKWMTKAEYEVATEGYSSDHLVNRYKQLAEGLCEHYFIKYEEQETLRQNNQHITRIVNALANLRHLEHISLHDIGYGRPEGETHKVFDSAGFDINHRVHRQLLLQPVRWSGAPHPSLVQTDPPLEMLGELFSELGRSGIRLDSVGVKIFESMVHGLPCLTSEQQMNVKKLVSMATGVSLEFCYMPRSSRAVHQAHEAALAIRSLTQSFFGAPGVEKLDLSLQGYGSPQLNHDIALRNLWPPDQALPRLQAIGLVDVRLDTCDLKMLVQRHKHTLKALRMHCGLIGDDVSDVPDILRGFQNLEKVSLRLLVSPGRFETFNVEVSNYILRRTSRNPLRSNV